MFLKFMKKGTLKTLHAEFLLPSPGTFSAPIKILSPGTHGYHLYTDEVLRAIKDTRYLRVADLWIAEIDIREPYSNYMLTHDIPAGVRPLRPIKCVVASSIRLVKKVSFKITPQGIILID